MLRITILIGSLIHLFLPSCIECKDLIPSDLLCKDPEGPSKLCIPSNYSKHVLPSSGVTNVSASFVIDDVMRVNHEDSTVTVVIDMRFNWYEPRVVINESLLRGKDELLNAPSIIQDLLWIPDIFLPNMLSITHTGFLDKSGIKIQISSKKQVYYSRNAVIKFLCHMEFDNFPFDVQRCDFPIQSAQYTSEHLVFNYEKQRPSIKVNSRAQALLKYKVKFKALSDFIVQLDNLRGEEETFSVVGISGTFGRKFLPYVINYFVPSGILVVVSWVNFTIPPQIVPGRLIPLITLFLMMVNLSTNATDHSPMANHINAIQIWILCCNAFVFMALVEYALVLYLKYLKDFVVSILNTNCSDNSAVKKVDNMMEDAKLQILLQYIDTISLILFPFLFFVSNTIYWFVFIPSF